MPRISWNAKKKKKKKKKKKIIKRDSVTLREAGTTRSLINRIIM